MITFLINQYWGIEQLHTQLTSIPTYHVLRPKKKSKVDTIKNKFRLYEHQTLDTIALKVIK